MTKFDHFIIILVLVLAAIAIVASFADWFMPSDVVDWVSEKGAK